MTGHYRTSSIQALSVIDDWGLDFAVGNVIAPLETIKRVVGAKNGD